MAGKENPFSRIIKKEPATEPVTPVSAVPGLESSLKDGELQQPVSESDPGHADDLPNAVNDNTQAGTENLGLPGEASVGRKGVAVDGTDVIADAEADAAALPQSKAEQFGLDVTAGQGGGSGIGQTSGGGGSGLARSGGVSGSAEPGSGSGNLIGGTATEQLAAAAGEQGPPIDLLAADPLASVLAAKTGGESLSDAQMALSAAALQAETAVETAPSVADGLTNATAGGAVLGGTAAAVVLDVGAAGVLVTGAAAAGTAAVLGAAAVAGAVGGVAAAATTLADQATDGASSTAILNSMGLRQVADVANLVGEVVVAANEVAAGAITPGQAVSQVTKTEAEKQLEAERKKQEEADRKAKEEAEKKAKEEAEKKAKEEADRKAKEEAEKGGGTKTTADPENQPLTPEQIAAIAAIKAVLQPQGLVPGDIDPVDGDGTNTGKGSEANLTAADRILLDKNAMLGQPPPGEEFKPAPSGGGNVSLGPDGREILLEDGANVNEARTEDLPDFNVGTDPLIGLPPAEEQEEPAEDSSPPILSIGQQDAKGADEG